MAYSYNPVDPAERFGFALDRYGELIEIAKAKGYTKDQAIELIKVWALLGIDSNTEAISGNY